MGTVSWSFCLQALTLLWNLAIARGQCARFKFPILDDSHVHQLAAGTRLNLTFELNTTECRNIKDNYSITVSKKDKTKNIFTDVCKMIIYQNGTCFSFRPEECVCGEKKGLYYLRKVVDKSDGTLWKWKVNDTRIAEIKEITFFITDDQLALRAGVTVSVLIVIVVCTAIIVLAKRRQLQEWYARIVRRLQVLRTAIQRSTADAVVYREEQPSLPGDRPSSDDLQSHDYVAIADGTYQSTGNSSKASSNASPEPRSVYLSLRRTAWPPRESNVDEDNTRSDYQPLNRIACPAEGNEPDGCPYTIPGFGAEGVPAPTDATEAVVHPAPANDDDNDESHEYLDIIV
ncbi:uncharacterized protein [Littorina saxatilis]|uniref:uncharacterized protein n=1 Tax=Littorina saxatilis TaxID=31220 RepID=UPI0038B4C297